MQEVRVHLSKTPEEKREEKSKAWIDRTVAFVAILSAATAIITVWISHRDAVEMAKTARDTLNAQIGATQLDERPIITLSPDRATVKYGKDYTLDFSLIVAGKTPARRVKITKTCRTEGIMKSDEKVMSLSFNLGDLNPTTRMGLACADNLPTSTLDIRLEITVEYSDMFHSAQNELPYTTSACYRIDTATPDTKPLFDQCFDKLPVAR